MSTLKIILHISGEKNISANIAIYKIVWLGRIEAVKMNIWSSLNFLTKLFQSLSSWLSLNHNNNNNNKLFIKFMCCSTLNHSGRLKIKNSILSTCQVTKYVHYNKKMRITYITGFGLAALNFKLNNQTF